MYVCMYVSQTELGENIFCELLFLFIQSWLLCCKLIEQKRIVQFPKAYPLWINTEVPKSIIFISVPSTQSPLGPQISRAPLSVLYFRCVDRVHWVIILHEHNLGRAESCRIGGVGYWHELQDTVEDDTSKVMHKILTRKAMFL